MTNDAHISTLRIRGARTDDVALRLRMSNVLGTADLRPDGAPPASILVIHRFGDPLPLRLTSRGNRMRVNPAWERAVQQRLGEWHRAAERPQRGVMASAAEAVVFADASEMLACLALDLARGEASQRWWWKSVLRRLPVGPPSGRIAAALQEDARSAPAAFDHLARWGGVEPVLGALTEADASRVLDAICKACKIATLTRLVMETADADAHEQGRIDPPTPAAEDEPPPDRGVRNHLADIPISDGWGHLRRGLMAVALTLHRNPHLVRRAEFTPALRTWMKTGFTLSDDHSIHRRARHRPSDAHTLRDSPGSDSPSYAVTDPVDGRRHKDEPTGRGSDGETHFADEEFPGLASDQDVGRASDTGGMSASGSPRPRERPGPPDLPPDATHRPHDEHDVHRSTADLHEPVLATNPDPRFATTGEPLLRREDRDVPIQSDRKDAIDNRDDARSDGLDQVGVTEDAAVYTRLGGLFYLINLMMHLDLPACFEKSWRLESDVGGWGMLDLLARALLPGDRDETARDPIWDCLADLDRRPHGSLPDTGLRSERPFAIPLEWLTLPPTEDLSSLRWAIRAGRFRAWSDAGFPILELPRDGRVSVEDAREVLRERQFRAFRLTRSAFHRAPVESSAGQLLQGLNPILRRWVAMVTPYLRFRLCKALDIDPVDSERLASQLLLQEARLYITSSHVDLVQSLESISIPVRRAGLDRNPGWWPLLGRVVYFHFE